MSSDSHKLNFKTKLLHSFWQKIRFTFTYKSQVLLLVIAKPGNVLLIHNVTRYLDEIYTCRATNGFGMGDTHEIRLRVRCKLMQTLMNTEHWAHWVRCSSVVDLKIFIPMVWVRPPRMVPVGVRHPPLSCNCNAQIPE